MLLHSALLAFNFLGTVLILIPLVFHIRNRNVAVICLCVMLSIINLIYFINTVVWNATPDENTALGRGYCDISTRYQLILSPLLLGCGIAILRHLAQILSSKGATAVTRHTKRRQNLIDLAIIFTVPAIIILLQTILFREIRYTITQTLGCQYSLVLYSPLVLLVVIWAPMLAVVAVIYATVILYSLNRKRKVFKEILRNSQSGLSASRFLKLFIMAVFSILIIAPITFYSLYQQTSVIDMHYKYTPHGSFKKIVVYYFETAPDDSYLWGQWCTAIVSIVLAALFGIGREPFRTYRTWAYSVPGARGTVRYVKDTGSRISDSFFSGSTKGLMKHFDFFTRSATSATSRASQSNASSHSDIIKDLNQFSVSPVGSRFEEDLPLEPITRQRSYAAATADTATLGSVDRVCVDGASEPNGKWDTEQALGMGHNVPRKLQGTTAARIWTTQLTEDAPLPSPNKIKVKRDLTQESSLK